MDKWSLYEVVESDIGRVGHYFTVQNSDQKDGDSVGLRSPDWKVAKVELPPGVKDQVLKRAEQSAGTKTTFDVLVELGCMEPTPAPDIDLDDEKNLKNLSEQEAAQWCSPSQLQRWFELQGQKMQPTYLPIM